MKRLLLVVFGALCLSACGPLPDATTDPKTLAPDKVKTEGVLVPAGATPVDLHGLDKLTKLDGDCFSEYIVLAGGIDSAGAQRYVLSFHLKGDPTDELSLYKFLSQHKCGKQQAEVHDKVVAAIGIKEDGRSLDPIDISYRTTSGRRLFL